MGRKETSGLEFRVILSDIPRDIDISLYPTYDSFGFCWPSHNYFPESEDILVY